MSAPLRDDTVLSVGGARVYNPPPPRAWIPRLWVVTMDHEGFDAYAKPIHGFRATLRKIAEFLSPPLFERITTEDDDVVCVRVVVLARYSCDAYRRAHRWRVHGLTTGRVR